MLQGLLCRSMGKRLNSENQEPKKLPEDVISEEKAEKVEARKIILGSQ